MAVGRVNVGGRKIEAILQLWGVDTDNIIAVIKGKKYLQQGQYLIRLNNKVVETFKLSSRGATKMQVIPLDNGRIMVGAVDILYGIFHIAILSEDDLGLISKVDKNNSLGGINDRYSSFLSKDTNLYVLGGSYGGICKLFSFTKEGELIKSIQWKGSPGGGGYGSKIYGECEEYLYAYYDRDDNGTTTKFRKINKTTFQMVDYNEQFGRVPRLSEEKIILNIKDDYIYILNPSNGDMQIIDRLTDNKILTLAGTEHRKLDIYNNKIFTITSNIEVNILDENGEILKTGYSEILAQKDDLTRLSVVGNCIALSFVQGQKITLTEQLNL